MDSYRGLIIESSAKCNIACVMCPTLSYRESKGIMSDEAFSRIEQYFHKVSFVDLTGWGEPLLDQRIFERIKHVRSYNLPVRIITNGTLLNNKNIISLIESGLTRVSISFDGGTESTYEAIRKGASYRKVINNISNLVKLRNECGSPLKISAEMVVMKQNSNELDAFINEMNAIGVDSLGIKPLNVLWSEEMLDLRLEKEIIADKIKAGQAVISRALLTCWDIHDEESPVNDCLAGAVHTPFISWDGYVSPCCNLGHPVSRVKADDRGNAIRNTRYNLGNINDRSLDDIWNSAEYVNFRGDLQKGRLPGKCEYCSLGPRPEKLSVGTGGNNKKAVHEEINIRKKEDYYRCERPDVLRLIPLRAKRILDVGCAGGALGAALKKRQKCEVIGVEVVEPVAEEAGNKLDSVIKGDIERVIDFLPDKYFDCLVMSDVIEHLKDPWSALITLRSKLVKEAVLVCSIPNVRYWPVLKGVIEGKWEYEDEGVLDKTHLRFFTRKSMYLLLEKAGFVIMKMDYNTDEKETVPQSLISGFKDAGYDIYGLEEESRVVQYLFSALNKEHVEHTLRMHELSSLTQEQYKEFIELGEGMFKKGDIEEAREIFQALQKIDDGNAMVWNNLGVISVQTGDITEAKEQFIRAIELDTKNEEAKKNLEIIEKHHYQSEPLSELLEEVPSLNVAKISSRDDFRFYASDMQPEYVTRERIERSYIKGSEPFSINGYCFVCKKHVDFHVDFLASQEINGLITPNWRERLVCPSCMLPNRMRASIQLFEQILKPAKDARIYITEQVTSFFRWLSRNYSHVTGSEFLGESIPFGETDRRGIRNESLTALTFLDGQFDFILSFDVFEHIPDLLKAFGECFRVIAPGGSLLFSVPFDCNSERNVVRAIVNENEEVEHLLPPEYHGDPVSDKGCLSFYVFGWEMLQQLREAGFDDVSALFYWSKEYGYLGVDQTMFIARKKDACATSGEQHFLETCEKDILKS